jgi:type III pantothenate kinase
MIDYVIEAGNSFVKIAPIVDGKLQYIERISLNESQTILNKIKGKNIALSSVANENLRNEIDINANIIFELSRNSLFPFKSYYQTPETWGMDRACNVCGALAKKTNNPILVVDIGTCIKFDFIDKNGFYHGGSISPGVHLRFQAMHNGTANLPLLKPSKSTELIGQSTHSSLLNGVMTGMQCEIKGMIAMYEQQFEKLTVILTGGDQIYFDFPEKSNIFVEQNLTIEGLYQLYKFHAE